MTTTRRCLLLFSAFVPLLSRFNSGQNSQTPSDTASIFNKHLDWMEQQFIPAAEAMPEDKFFWGPTSGEFHGVRNFAEQLIHVAAVNFALSAAILDESPPKGSRAEAMKTRSAILQYLKESFMYTHRAFSSMTDKNANLPIKHPRPQVANEQKLHSLHCGEYYGSWMRLALHSISGVGISALCAIRDSGV
jgi:hypothetical protein